MTEFIINSFLSLRLEDNQTNIYIDGELFKQCEYVLSNIPRDEIDFKKFEDIESIDEAVDLMVWSTHGPQYGFFKIMEEIEPETVFWVHCSNLQAWYEHDYDSWLLDSNLAFPLLKKLVQVGDPIANRVFKEEIEKRLESGYPNVIIFIFESGLLKGLNQEVVKQYIERSVLGVLDKINYKHYKNKYIYVKPLLKAAPRIWKKYELPKEFLLILLDVIDQMSDREKYSTFSYFVKKIKSSSLTNEYVYSIKTQFLSLLKTLNKLSGFDRGLAFLALLDIAKKMGWIIECFPTFLKILDKDLVLLEHRYSALSDLINTIKGTNLMNKYIIPIKNLSLLQNLHKNLHKLPIHNKKGPYYKFIETIKGTELVSEDALQKLLSKGNELENEDVFQKLKTKIITSKYDYTWKIMMLGDAKAGKASLISRYVSGFFLDDLKLASGVNFYSKITNYKGVKVKLQIWPFEVDERSRFLMHKHNQGANAAFFLYNINIPNSLDLLLNWTQTIRERAGDIPIMLVGTINHLEKPRAVTREKGIQAAKKHNLSAFIEVSSKTGQNVEKAFDIIIEMMIKRQGPNANVAKNLPEPLIIVTLPEIIYKPKPLKRN